jgi:O-antigen ligase
VVVATGVSLAAQGLYQYTIDFPVQQAQAADPEAFRAMWAERTGEQFEADSLAFQRALERYQADNVYSSFGHPNSFAGYLALLFPAAVGYALVAWRQRSWSGQPWAATFAAVLMGGVLWLTHSRGAILGTLLVGGIALAVCWRHLRPEAPFLRPRYLVGAVVLVATLVVLFLVIPSGLRDTALDKARASLGKRLDYWTATWAMVRDHAWLGVGPGNFDRFYPRYMVPTADEQIRDPHNFVLELWATCGVLALVGVALACGAFFARSWLSLRGPWPPAEPERLAPGPERTNWEFYLGGMAGLLVAFLIAMLREVNAPPGQAPAEAILFTAGVAAGRSLIWFAVFALYDGIRWSGPSRTLALTAGVAALLLNLCVSGGILFPSVAQPLWVVAALALGGPTQAPDWARRLQGRLPDWFWTMLPVPLLAGACVAFFALQFYPVTLAESHRTDARRWQQEWSRLRGQSMEKLDTGERIKLVGKIVLHEQAITQAFQQAREADPGNAIVWQESARWGVEEAERVPERIQGAEATRRKRKLGDTALEYAETTVKLDPESSKPRYAEFNARLRLAKLYHEYPQDRDDEVAAAGRALEAISRIDPAREAGLRWELADSLFGLSRDARQRNDPEAAERLARAAREEAKRARELDDRAPGPLFKLSKRQREQVDRWLEEAEAN